MPLGERGFAERGGERWGDDDSYTGRKCNSICKVASCNYRDWRYRYLYLYINL